MKKNPGGTFQNDIAEASCVSAPFPRQHTGRVALPLLCAVVVFQWQIRRSHVASNGRGAGRVCAVRMCVALFFRDILFSVS